MSEVMTTYNAMEFPREWEDKANSYAAEYMQNAYYLFHVEESLCEEDEEWMNKCNEWLKSKGHKAGDWVLILFDW
jgi:hypothetical protein